MGAAAITPYMDAPAPKPMVMPVISPSVNSNGVLLYPVFKSLSTIPAVARNTPADAPIKAHAANAAPPVRTVADAIIDTATAARQTDATVPIKPYSSVLNRLDFFSISSSTGASLIGG